MHIVWTEFLKLRTTRLWWGLASALLGLSALIAILTLVFVGETPGFAISGGLAQRSLFTSAGFNATFALVFGIIGMAGEYKQGTITPTFLAAPQRWRVIVAKALAYAIGGFLLGLSSNLLVAGIAYVGLAIKDIAVVIPASEIFEVLGGSTATTAFYGVLGVAVGAVIPNQIAALIGALVEQLIAEPLLFNFFPEEARFLIGGAGSILSGTPNLAATLSLWAAAGVLAAWCLALLALGSVITERKDIT